VDNIWKMYCPWDDLDLSAETDLRQFRGLLEEFGLKTDDLFAENLLQDFPDQQDPTMFTDFLARWQLFVAETWPTFQTPADVEATVYLQQMLSLKVLPCTPPKSDSFAVELYHLHVLVACVLNDAAVVESLKKALKKGAIPPPLTGTAQMPLLEEPGAHGSAQMHRASLHRVCKCQYFVYKTLYLSAGCDVGPVPALGQANG